VHVIDGGIVGRRRELEALRSWLAAATAGEGRIVLCVGEPGIGKTRLAQELAGMALAGGTTVVWGRCTETEGAPAFRPWRQVLRSLGLDPDLGLDADVTSPEDRFRVCDDLAEAVCGAADLTGLVVVLDDIHWADEPSLLVLRNLAEQISAARLLCFAALRDVEPASALRRVLPDLLRSPAVERLDLRGFGLAEVREQLSKAGASGSEVDARAVLDVTGGNPLFVREVARAMADGTWTPDRPPRTVLDVVGARLDRVTDDCRRFVQAAAVVGREFSLAIVAPAVGRPVATCFPLIDEAVAHGLLDRVGDDYRFVHALIRDAVEASLATADRVALHRAVAEATELLFVGDLSEHLCDLARHWAALAPYGEAAIARAWAIRAAEDAVQRLDYEEGFRQYRAGLAFDAPPLPDAERCRVLVALGRAAYFAGDVHGCEDAAAMAATAARAAQSPELMGEAALVLEAVPEPGVNAVAKQLCEDALAALGDAGHEAMRARLLAQRSHLAFYDGEQDRVESLSTTALVLARASRQDQALIDALHARKEACPGPTGRAERMLLATEMLALAERTRNPRAAMWGELWRIAALMEGGQLVAAAEELPALQATVNQVGGPVSAWHHDQVAACIALAQGRYADAAAIGRRAFDRMRPVEASSATGAYLSLQCALARHIGATDEAVAIAQRRYESPPRFKTMSRVAHAFLLLRVGLPDEAAASYQQAGPVETWSMPAFFVLHGYVYAALAAAELGRHDDLAELLDRLRPFRGEHASSEGISYLGPIELTLGRGAATLGRLDAAIDDLTAAAAQADRAGAPGFAAEARYHLATALHTRNRPGDRDRAVPAAHDANQLARTLGMAAYVERASALATQLGSGPGALSTRESEVASLVAEGLTNRQIALRLFISERTAQNHVQHILTKMGFTRRSQIAAWCARTSR
jgi:DNA-binding CsgD family transcriptional regulator